ncbi:MAG: hypothetical protein GWP35_03215 [Proteobacteria bacterium]|nr:hypothetical protein [Pseudomonadota bacterium]
MINFKQEIHKDLTPLIALLVLFLSGCGMGGFFTQEEPRSPASSSAQKNPAPIPTEQFSNLRDLELALVESQPAMRGLPILLEGEVQESNKESWIPGARWNDSDAGEDIRNTSGDRQVALDWSLSAMANESRESRRSRSDNKLSEIRLQQTQMRLLRQLREQWCEYWYLTGAEKISEEYLTQIEVLLEKDTDWFRSDIRALVEKRLRTWNQRISLLAGEKALIQESLNLLLERPLRASLPVPDLLHDDRFIGIETRNRFRRHPNEILAAEQSRWAQRELGLLDSEAWPDIVLGAHTHTDHDQPVVSSGGGGETDWILTVGVEIPLGRNLEQDRQQWIRDELGSGKIELMRVTKKVSDDIVDAQMRFEESQALITRLEGKVLTVPQDVMKKLTVSNNAQELTLQWQKMEEILSATLQLKKACSDRAIARYQLVDLLAIPEFREGTALSRRTTAENPFFSE